MEQLIIISEFEVDFLVIIEINLSSFVSADRSHLRPTFFLRPAKTSPTTSRANNKHHTGSFSTRFASLQAPPQIHTHKHTYIYNPTAGDRAASGMQNFKRLFFLSPL